MGQKALGPIMGEAVGTTMYPNPAAHIYMLFFFIYLLCVYAKEYACEESAKHPKNVQRQPLRQRPGFRPRGARGGPRSRCQRQHEAIGKGHPPQGNRQGNIIALCGPI